MAALKYKDEHNKVGYLEKPKGSDDYHQVLNFLRGSHLRQDLLKLYGMVVKYYEDHPLAGAGMMLWGDLQVLFESHEGGHGSLVWSDQQQWHIRNGSYPLSVQLMKKMLKHKLEIEINGVGNDMTYAEQLIQFIKNQIAASIPSA
ncbi:hypothetical protein Tco_0521138 [Tanacetum coccineum]